MGWGDGLDIRQKTQEETIKSRTVLGWWAQRDEEAPEWAAWKDARRGRSRAPSTSGALGPKEGEREPHLNLPEDVTTPRDAGPMGGRRAGAGARRNWAGPH